MYDWINIVGCQVLTPASGESWILDRASPVGRAGCRGLQVATPLNHSCKTAAAMGLWQHDNAFIDV